MGPSLVAPDRVCRSRRTFEAQHDWEASLHRLLNEEEPDADEFWRKVKTNLRASNVRLMVATDEIPDSLARVVEFLNEQMREVDVLAVEIKRYIGGGRETFVARVTGRSAKLRSMGSSLTLGDIIDRFPVGAVRSAAQQIVDCARDAGATFEPGPRGFSIRGSCQLWSQPVTVAWLYPSEIAWMRTQHFSFGAAIFSGYDPPAPTALRELLLRYAKQFEHDPYANDASSQGVVAWYIEPEATVQHVDVLVERLERVLAELRGL